MMTVKNIDVFSLSKKNVFRSNDETRYETFTILESNETPITLPIRAMLQD